MKTTNLPALLLVGALLALAAPAQAGPIMTGSGLIWGIGDKVVTCAGDDRFCITIGVKPCDKTGVGNACDFARNLNAYCDEGSDCTINDPTDDRDHDLMPDEAESNVCGREVGRWLAGLSMTTRCNTHRDMEALPDDDRDGVPDGLEAWLCYVENDNTDLDGSCTGTNWTL